MTTLSPYDNHVPGRPGRLPGPRRRRRPRATAARRQGRRAAGHRGRAGGPYAPRSSRPTPRTSTRAREAGTSEAIIDRLTLTPERVRAIAADVRDVAALPDPVGEVVRGSTLPNGIDLRQVRVPLGVVGIIYEARPNVTVDAAALCLKSGNAVLLRGSSSAYASNTALVRVLRDAVGGAGPARRRGAARARREPRLRTGADAGPRPGRRAHPARRRLPDPYGRRGVHRPGHRDRHRQLPRLRRRAGRPRHGRRHPDQLQGPAAQRLQLRRDPPRPPGHRRRVPAARPGRAGRRRGHRARRRAGARRTPRAPRPPSSGHRRRTGRPSTCRTTSPPPSSTPWTRPSRTSGSGPPATPRRSSPPRRRPPAASPSWSTRPRSP